MGVTLLGILHASTYRIALVLAEERKKVMRTILVCSVAVRPQRRSFRTHRLTATASTSSKTKISATDTQIASTIAGVLSRLLLHPMDCIKTRLQHLRSQPFKSVNPGRVVIDFIVAERLAGLYRGILGALAGVLPYSMSTFVATRGYICFMLFHISHNCLSC